MLNASGTEALFTLAALESDAVSHLRNSEMLSKISGNSKALCSLGSGASSMAIVKLTKRVSEIASTVNLRHKEPRHSEVLAISKSPSNQLDLSFM
jgi:hypothetical protein